MAERAGLGGGLERVALILEMVKFRHTIFALPFALCGAWFAADGMPAPLTLVWIVLCAVSARSAAMGWNRFLDRHLDATNPRTCGRALPAGLLSPAFTLAFVALNCALFLLFAALLNSLCLALAPLVLAVLLGYSWFKRFTVLVHLFLGFALALAPMGAWLAVRGDFAGDLRIPLLLGALVLTWVAGFDIIYSCQDIEHDRSEGLHALPARFGERAALLISFALHLLAIALCILLGVAARRAWIYALGAALMSALLIGQHLLIGPGRLQRVQMAFFTLNGWAGVVFFGATALDIHLLG